MGCKLGVPQAFILGSPNRFLVLGGLDAEAERLSASRPSTPANGAVLAREPGPGAKRGPDYTMAEHLDRLRLVERNRSGAPMNVSSRCSKTRMRPLRHTKNMNPGAYGGEPRFLTTNLLGVQKVSPHPLLDVFA